MTANLSARINEWQH